MKQTTIEAIQQAKDSNLIVPFVLASEKVTKPSAKTNGQIIALWVSRYDNQLIDALVDIYKPLELLFQEVYKRGQGCFLFVNTSTESILCMYLGLYNRLNVLLLDSKVQQLEKDSKIWKKFTKIDRKNLINDFTDDLEEFGKYAHRWNVLPSNDEDLEIMLDANPCKDSFVLLGEAYSREEVEELIKELETLSHFVKQALERIKRFFPNIDWGDMNNQDAW